MANTSDPIYLPYSPKTTKAQTIPVSALSAHNINFVRITSVDFANAIRFRVLPISSFRRLLASSRPGIAIAKCVFGMAHSSLRLPPGFGPVGEYWFAADLTSIRLCPYAPGHATIMGWFQDMTPAPGRMVGTGVPMCPRSVLQRIVDTAASYNAAFLVGVESEFILLKNTNPIEAINPHGWGIAQALPSGAKETEVMEEIACALMDSGVELMLYHSEAAPGQYEVVTGPLPPLEAADALVHTRETIINVAGKHGLRATFAPRLNLDSCGSAAHTHISVHPINSDQPLGIQAPSTASDNLLTPLERVFLAGLLDHLPAACAFTLPIRASYARMLDGIWSGGTWVSWGENNRETPVRLCAPAASAHPEPVSPSTAPTPSGNHFEVRCIDGTSSPYLAFSSLLGAGLLGIQSQAPLVEKNCRVAAAQMTEEEREAVGVRRRLPRTWEEARDALEDDEELKSLLGDVVKYFLTLRENLDVMLHTPETDAEKIQKLVETY